MIMGELSIKDLLRAGHVHRWQIVRTVRDQTLAEHSFNVAMISIELAELLIDDLSDAERYIILNWALRHDTPEIYLGDIATPIKRRIKEIDPNVIDIIEEEISEKYKKSKDQVNCTVYKIIVKLADIIDGSSFMRIEGLGDHAEAVIEKLDVLFGKLVDVGIKYYSEIEWEKAVSFYEEVLSGVDGTLDFEFKEDR